MSLALVAAVAVVSAHNGPHAVEGAGDGNSHRFNERRWPWTYGQQKQVTALGPNCPHCPAGSEAGYPGQSRSAWLAVDVNMYDEKVRSVDGGTVVSAANDGGKAGSIVRTRTSGPGEDGIEGTPDDMEVFTTYEHLKPFSFAVKADDQFAPGRILATSGNSGGVPYHLHFQRHDADSFDSAAILVPPINGWTAIMEKELYVSTNAGVGYAAGDSYRNDFASKWRAEGGYLLGVTGTASLGWYPCRRGPNSLPAPTAFVYACNHGPDSNPSRWTGYVQMLLGPRDAHRVLMRRTGGAPFVVGRGILGALTDLGAAGDPTVLAGLGYPTSGRYSYSDSGDPAIAWRQDFQAGYVLQATELPPEVDPMGVSCRTEAYVGGAHYHTAYYCEEPWYLDDLGVVPLSRGAK